MIPGPAARPARTSTVWLRADPTEARLVERVIAVSRALLAMSALMVVRLDPSARSGSPFAIALLLGYAVYALILLVPLLRISRIPSYLPVVLQASDIVFGVLLTLLSAGPSGDLKWFLLYPLLGAAYRWGFREVMLTAVALDSLMGLDVLLRSWGLLTTGPLSTDIELDRFLMRAVYVAATGAAVGYLAENEKRRRFEAHSISSVMMRARFGGKLQEAINLVLEFVRRIFKARLVLLVMREKETGRVWQWTDPPSNPGDDQTIVRAEIVTQDHHQDFLFDSPGAAFHSDARLWSRPGQRFSSIAIDDAGQPVPAPGFSPPSSFVAAYPFRRLIGVSLTLGDDWSGRLFVVGPKLGVNREQSVRFALNIIQQVSPTVFGHYLVRRLHTRAKSLERGRIARELHDGVTQSLLGLEMELVVLHRRASVQAPQLTEDLARVHQIVRKEVITVRELMEGIRVGDVESGDLLQHLSEIVDRFGRYTGIAARFLSDGQAVTLTPHVRRQVARIVHEALVNVRRHADAERVIVRADVDGTCWKLSIEDDGRGFPFAGRLAQEELDKFRQGPRTIGERLRLINGVMTVESKPGFGAKVEIGIPLRGN